MSNRVRLAFPILPLAALIVGLVGAQVPPDRCLVPAAVRDPIVQEISGEEAFLHVQMLAGSRDRTPEEYKDIYYETAYIRDQAVQAGLSEVIVEKYPSRDTWDGEEGDLWMVKPVLKKIASFNQVPTSLAQGSMSADVEAELVYVGAGREADYAGKDVAGKIVLGSGSVGGVFGGAVSQRGAAGALGTGSSGVSGNTPGYTLDQIGWSSVSPRPDKGGFGFALSLRQFLELRGLVERGEKVVLRAHVRAKTYPSQMNVISAVIPGSDPAAGELLCVAHAFETIATPGANDNCTGVATLLEIGRTLARLIRDGVLPKPRRTIHFLWGNEISGSTAYMNKHPELQDKLLAALNFDMTGANLATTDCYLRIKMTPDGRASYLNDLIASLLQYVDQSEIRTTQGANATFNYRLAPLATITSGSDHTVFLAAGIPTMQFNYWPDNFYHSSADRIIHVDPTELKRVGVVAASAFAYLAGAGAPEARDLAWEAASNGAKWIAEVGRQSVRLLGADPAKIHEQYKAALTKVGGAFGRAKGGVESVRTLAAAPEVEADIRQLTDSLAADRDAASKRLESVYKGLCGELKIKPAPPVLTAQEIEYSKLVPRRRFKVYSEEARKLSQAARGGQPAVPPAGAAPAAPPSAQPPAKPQAQSQAQAQAQPPAAAAKAPAQTTPGGRPGGAGRGMGFASTSTNYFIDGKRSILEIYNAVRAECGNLQIGSQDAKYAYVLGPEYPDVDMETVVNIIRNLEKTGVVEILQTPRGKR
ncbi:MAG: M28 family peptidase [Candidatus Aminicenantes bacterium]|nr:M28 family peptidase [Candidatus Aminicenantes bacterium]